MKYSLCTINIFVKESWQLCDYVVAFRNEQKTQSTLELWY